MKKLLLIAVMAMLAGCKIDPEPHCWKCTHKDLRTQPNAVTTEMVCDKTQLEIHAYEERNNGLDYQTVTTCVYRDTTK